MPFVVERWRWYSGDSALNEPYASSIINGPGCTPPAADTNPAPCAVRPSASGVLEIDAIVNGISERVRKNISAVANPRICDAQVLKKWGRISSRYRANESLRKKPHKGRDGAVPVGTPVYAAEAGKVVDRKWGDSTGYRVVIRGAHNSYYFHLSSIDPDIQYNVNVAAGTLLGYSGNTGASTGPHLHFQQHSPGPIWVKLKTPQDTHIDPCYY